MRFLIFVIALVLVQQAIAIRFFRYPWRRTPRCSRMFEVYKDCGTACPQTCNNYNVEIMCTDECVEECQCMDGYVRNTADNSCCLPSQCPAVEPEPEPEPQPEPTNCPANEVYNECGSACASTCANYKNPPQFCTMNCVVGCECVAGYVRNGTGSCCLPEEC